MYKKFCRRVSALLLIFSIFIVLGSNWGQNQFFCKNTKKYSVKNSVFSALFLVAEPDLN